MTEQEAILEKKRLETILATQYIERKSSKYRSKRDKRKRLNACKRTERELLLHIIFIEASELK